MGTTLSRPAIMNLQKGIQSQMENCSEDLLQDLLIKFLKVPTTGIKIKPNY